MVDRICRADARAFVPPKRLRVERRDTARRLDDGRSSLPSKNCPNRPYGTLDFKGALAKYSVIFVSAVLEQWFRSPQVATGRREINSLLAQIVQCAISFRPTPFF
jgi:hypothetical protein